MSSKHSEGLSLRRIPPLPTISLPQYNGTAAAPAQHFQALRQSKKCVEDRCRQHHNEGLHGHRSMSQVASSCRNHHGDEVRVACHFPAHLTHDRPQLTLNSAMRGHLSAFAGADQRHESSPQNGACQCSSRSVLLSRSVVFFTSRVVYG